VPWSKVYSRRFLSEHELCFEEVLASNDVMFSVMAGHLAKEIKVEDKCFYCVTKHSGSLTQNFSEDIIESRYDVEKRRIEYLHANNIYINRNSVTKFINQFYSLNTIEVSVKAASLYWSGKIDFIPHYYYHYLYSPKKMFAKVMSIVRSRRNIYP
jgi:hypothetical protein